VVLLIGRSSALEAAPTGKASREFFQRSGHEKPEGLSGALAEQAAIRSSEFRVFTRPGHAALMEMQNWIITFWEFRNSLCHYGLLGKSARVRRNLCHLRLDDSKKSRFEEAFLRFHLRIYWLIVFIFGLLWDADQIEHLYK
jgi:hypothetical protein